MNMDFLDFIVYQGKPGLFWIVQIGGLAATLVLFYVLRKDNYSIDV